MKILITDELTYTPDYTTCLICSKEYIKSIHNSIDRITSRVITIDKTSISTHPNHKQLIEFMEKNNASIIILIENSNFIRNDIIIIQSRLKVSDVKYNYLTTVRNPEIL